MLLLLLNVFGGKNECDVNFKFDSNRNSKIIIIMIPVYFIIYEIFYELFTMGISECVTLFGVPFLQFTA